mgnify:FL=1|tara:strand:- start:316 stop:729 length:414 start_codon:yes stop_codon:yes gene_type:complete
MPKLTLDLEEDFDFTLIGISCHSKDYRLAYEFNKLLSYEFTRDNDLELRIKGESSSYAFFSFIDEDNYVEYYLVSNRGSSGKLIPEEKLSDYFLIMKGDTNETTKKQLLTKVNEIQPILKAYLIEVEQLKSKRNLIF